MCYLLLSGLALLCFQLVFSRIMKEEAHVSKLSGSPFWLHGVFRPFVNILGFWFLLRSVSFKVSLSIQLWSWNYRGKQISGDPTIWVNTYWVDVMKQLVRKPQIPHQDVVKIQGNEQKEENQGIGRNKEDKNPFKGQVQVRHMKIFRRRKRKAECQPSPELAGRKCYNLRCTSSTLVPAGYRSLLNLRVSQVFSMPFPWMETQTRRKNLLAGWAGRNRKGGNPQYWVFPSVVPMIVSLCPQSSPLIISFGASQGVCSAISIVSLFLCQASRLVIEGDLCLTRWITRIVLLYLGSAPKVQIKRCSVSILQSLRATGRCD